MYMSHNKHVQIELATMNDMTLTALRRTLFRVADRVLSTGTPVRIRRRGHVLTLAAEADGKSPGRPRRLKRRRLIVGEASTLWKVKAGKWRGRQELG